MSILFDCWLWGLNNTTIRTWFPLLFYLGKEKLRHSLGRPSRSDFVQFELSCFQIITYVGTARTHFINAIHCAKEGKYDEAAELIKQGDEAFSLGHNVHADLLAMDANGEISNGYMLLMHAEDQLMSAEAFRILADEFITLYKRIDEK